MDSILISIKKMLGIAEEYTPFDIDIILHINSVFMILNQLGIGPSSGFRIEDDSATWSDFTEDKLDVEAVKSYIYLKVRLLFDPPSSSAAMESINRLISELEWRLNVAAELNKSNGEEVAQND